MSLYPARWLALAGALLVLAACSATVSPPMPVWYIEGRPTLHSASGDTTDHTVRSLDGEVVGGLVYVFVEPAGWMRRVEFILDGAAIADLHQGPFGVIIDTFTLTDGEHDLLVRAYAPNGRLRSSQLVNFIVDNAPTTDPPAPPADPVEPPDPIAPPPTGTTYYVSQAGNDANDGLSEGSPKRSLAAVEGLRLRSGDTVLFRRGDTWAGTTSTKWGALLRLGVSGTPDQPITFGAYGTGPPPIFRNDTRTNFTRVIVLAGDYLVLDGVEVTGAHEVGVQIDGRGSVVRNSVIHNTGKGIMFQQPATGSVAERNVIRDGRMVVNTPGGDDDYGAIGIAFYSGGNKALHNVLYDLIAHSYDYGTDGGAFEIFTYGGVSVDDVEIAHNTVYRSDGFIEVGGMSDGATVARLHAHHNLVLDSNLDAWHLQGGASGFGTILQGALLEHNTFVDRRGGWYLMWFSRPLTAGQLTLRDNAFYLAGLSGLATASGGSVGALASAHNLYFRADGATTAAYLGFTPGGTDVLGVDPRFVNVGSYATAPTPYPPFDLTPRSGSPLIGASSTGGDIGAVQFGGSR